MSLLIGAGTGCASKSSSTAIRLRAADFKPSIDQSPLASPNAQASINGSLLVSTEPARVDADKVVSEIVAREGIDDVMVIAGAPQRTLSATDVISAPSSADQQRQTVERAQVRMLQVDHLVGQVNGQPVFANEFLKPMDARFAREAERLGTQQWLVMAKGVIDEALFDRLRDELLLAEFQSTLTLEQRMGVLAFIEQVRDDLISGSLGSSEQANRRFLETEGLGLDDKVEDVTEQQFIVAQLRKAIGDRVHVSFVDVQRYYDQHLDEFYPLPVARFRILRVPTSDAPLIGTIVEALGSGVLFGEVARAHSTWNPDDQNLHEVILESRSYEDTQFFGPDSLNDLARSLEPGEVSAPIVVGSNQYWIWLEEIHQPEGRTLYDVQQEIENSLRGQLAQAEESRYVAQLFLRGNFSSIQEMSRALLTFASEQYLIRRQGIAGTDGSQRESSP